MTVRIAPLASRAPLFVLCLVLAHLDAVASASIRGASMAHPKRWLIVSQPSSKTISYAALPRGASLNENSTMHTLINGSGSDSDLSMPMGLAVDQYNGRLFVADPVLKQIISYRLNHVDDPQILRASEPTTWATNVEARWVAVDPSGNVFFTDEASNNIMLIQATNGKKAEPQIIYGGASMTSVNSPGGIAADSMRVYWVNKQLGSQSGSVMSAPKMGVNPGQDPKKVVLTLASNSNKSYGLCRSMANLFYTQPSKEVFGVEADGQGGGSYAVVTDRLTNPRGCAFDGDGTVYVADRGAGAVYSYAGNMQTLGYALVQKTAALDDAFGTAIFSGARRPFAGLGALFAAGLAVIAAG